MKNMTARYTVIGANADELVERAQAVWRQLCADPESKLPGWARIDVSPSLDTRFGNGSSEITEWEAEVYVRLPAAGER